MEIYCLKCRSFTPNEDLYVDKITTTKGKDRMMQKAKCGICGIKKNRFIKKIQDKSFEIETNNINNDN